MQPHPRLKPVAGPATQADTGCIANLLLIADDAAVSKPLESILIPYQRQSPKMTTSTFSESLELLARKSFDVILWSISNTDKFDPIWVDKLLLLAAHSAVIAIMDRFDHPAAVALARKGVQDVYPVGALTAE